jgi:hypothetical protein
VAALVNKETKRRRKNENKPAENACESIYFCVIFGLFLRPVTLFGRDYAYSGDTFAVPRIRVTPFEEPHLTICTILLIYRVLLVDRR